jgi:hypothetical protein
VGVRITSFISHRVTEEEERALFVFKPQRTLLLLCGSSERTRAGVRLLFLASRRGAESLVRQDLQDYEDYCVLKRKANILLILSNFLFGSSESAQAEERA